MHSTFHCCYDVRHARFCVFVVACGCLYQNIGINQILRVTVAPPVARFTVTGNRGENACTINSGELDTASSICRADATASSGNIVYWRYTYSFGSATDVYIATDKMAAVDPPSGCSFLAGRSTSSDDVGTYIQMGVELVVEDRDGARSSPASKTIKVYTNGSCSY